MCLTLTSGLHLQDLQISTRGRPLWRRFAGSFLCEHSTMCRSTVSIRETIRGKRWSTARVILNAHLTYTKSKKTEAEYLERDEEGARRPQKSLPGCPIISTCRNGVRRKQKRGRFRSWFSAECLFGEEKHPSKL